MNYKNHAPNQIKKKSNCIFCDREKVNSELLFETSNFYVKHGLCLISPGHVMIIPKKHFKCFGELPDYLDEEFLELKQKLIKFITKHFSEPFLIEQGNWAQSVFHAHIHLIPHKTKNHDINIIQEMVIPSKIPFKKTTWKEIKEIYEKENGYVMYEQNNQLIICDIKGIDENSTKHHKYLSYRGFLTKIVGLKHILDWRIMTEEDKIIDQEKIKLTKKIFNKLNTQSKLNLKSESNILFTAEQSQIPQ
ncbi:HIT family protein [Candidatus Woesearchaeota archaeon]|jgi:diadenosine tetraphosphate (Ap4A) HIT family hydrolase|nr:HIT family protein [Candidatus Woesearchaeota archaeon]